MKFEVGDEIKIVRSGNDPYFTGQIGFLTSMQNKGGNSTCSAGRNTYGCTECKAPNIWKTSLSEVQLFCPVTELRLIPEVKKPNSLITICSRSFR